MSTPADNAVRPAHDELDHRVRSALAALDRSSTGTPADAPADDDRLAAFDAMAASRLLDIAARRMREQGRGYYTIGSAGHESNALVAQALRPTDPALLHYRSGAFFVARHLQAGHRVEYAIRAVLRSMFATTTDPASGGRHKVFGAAELAIIPQTSTIASHLPRAVGVAFAIGRAQRIGAATRWPADAVAVCSFGDASLNHSTTAGALNTAGYTTWQGLPLPLLLVCEDNGLGISVPTPTGWVETAARRPGIEYFAADGDDPDTVRETVRLAADHVRTARRPALLHLRTVRFLGHAGTDVESGYRRPAQIAAELDRDPLLALARTLPGHDLAARYDRLAGVVDELAAEVAEEPTLADAAAVMAPLAPRAGRVSVPVAPAEQRAVAFGGRAPETAGALTLAQAINATLADQLAARPSLCVFGEDVGRKGGVYGLTRGLQARFGAPRVFDTLLDEQAILGLGLGLGVSGLLPVPEIQYLAYLHNAIDQLRGEGASLRFFSGGEFTNPMVVRIAGLAYQKGFGGHFHNDNAVAALRDIPGLVVAVPARPEDAGPMLRACVAAAEATGQVSVFLEPIALYHERDLYEPGDRGWLGGYRPDGLVPIDSARLHPVGDESAPPALTIVTFGNGVRMSLRVAARLATVGVRAEVLDLRWVSPLPLDDVLAAAARTGRVLVADETRASGGVGEGVVAGLVERGFDGRIARVAAHDSYIPLGAAANLVLLSEQAIEAAAHRLLEA